MNERGAVGPRLVRSFRTGQRVRPTRRTRPSSLFPGEVTGIPASARITVQRAGHETKRCTVEKRQEVEMAQLDAPVRFVWTTNGRVRRVDEPITPERLEAIARLLERASAAFNRGDTETRRKGQGKTETE